MSFESRYDTCSSCFPDDSCPHQSTHCAARPTRLRPLPHAPPPRERHRLHRFRTFPDVSGRFRMFLKVSGSGATSVQRCNDRRDRGSAARTDRAFLPGGRASAERTIITIRERTETTRMQRHISAAAAVWVIRTAAGRTDLPDDALQIEQRLVDRPGLRSSVCHTHAKYSWVLGYEYPRVLPSYLGAC